MSTLAINSRTIGGNAELNQALALNKAQNTASRAYRMAAVAIGILVVMIILVIILSAVLYSGYAGISDRIVNSIRDRVVWRNTEQIRGASGIIMPTSNFSMLTIRGGGNDPTTVTIPESITPTPETETGTDSGFDSPIGSQVMVVNRGGGEIRFTHSEAVVTVPPNPVLPGSRSALFVKLSENTWELVSHASNESP